VAEGAAEAGWFMGFPFRESEVARFEKTEREETERRLNQVRASKDRSGRGKHSFPANGEVNPKWGGLFRTGAWREPAAG